MSGALGSRISRILPAVLAAATGSGCVRGAGGSGAPPAPAPVRFKEVSTAVGARFQHFSGARGHKYLPETTGSGLAFLDYDNDGWQDLLCMNGTSWPGDANPHVTPHLFHNLKNGSFADVTRAAGLGLELYGMGAAVGDYDNDGFPDLYLTALGPNHLLRNTLGDPGRAGGPIFRDVTAPAGVAGRPIPEPGMGLRWKWSTSAAWLDYDRDGRLDLFVCNYVKWSPKTDVACTRADGRKGYCPPDNYLGYPSTLYHNEGVRNGSVVFRDVGAATGIANPSLTGKSFGVAVADYNGDGWPDLAVANDTWPNFLFLNDRGRRFTEQGLESGFARTEGAKTKAGMGIDAADWNNNGRFGLLVGNFAGESLSLFENQGDGAFTERAAEAGMAAPSLAFLTFGLFFCDFDLDGRQDALTANGHIDDLLDPRNSGATYRERPQLFLNRGGGRFDEIGTAGGLTGVGVGRGAGWADWDNDGDPDFAVLSNGEGLMLYRSEGKPAHHWARFRLRGDHSNRDGIGALVRVTLGAVTQSQYVRSGGSFLSESQHEPLFGLGDAGRMDRVEVDWPNGRVTSATSLPVDRAYLVDEASGHFSERKLTSGPPL